MRQHLPLVVQSSWVCRFLLSEGWAGAKYPAPTMYLSTVPGRHHCSPLGIGGEGID